MGKSEGMEAWIPVILSALGSGGILMVIVKGIGKALAKREEARATEKLGLLNKIEALQTRIFDMQQDRIAEQIKLREASSESAKALSEMSALLKTTLAAFLQQKGTPP
jgi:flagellar basal body-associated protein FliL